MAEFVVAFPTLGDLWSAWIERHCRVPDRHERGKPFREYDWQFWCTANHGRVRPGIVHDPANPLLNQAFVYRRSQVIAPQYEGKIGEQEYFDKGVLMIAMVKAGVELAFETMVDSGIIEESAYYESLHELPLIANTIARKRLYEMNVVISDTAEYGNYLFSYACVPLLKPFMAELQPGDLGKAIPEGAVDNAQLRDVNEAIRSHAIEQVGKKLRGYMTDMKRIAVAG